jgi:hypothetical protein
MNFKQWFANHTISAKTAITVWGFLVALWSTNDAFRGYLMGIYNAIPSGAHNFIAGVAIPALILWKTQRYTTSTATVMPGQTGATQAFAIASVDGEKPKP